MTAAPEPPRPRWPVRFLRLLVRQRVVRVIDRAELLTATAAGGASWNIIEQHWEWSPRRPIGQLVALISLQSVLWGSSLIAILILSRR